MRCFRVTERIENGLLVQTELDDEEQPCPYIPTPEGSTARLLLGEGLTEGIKRCTPVPLQLVEAAVEFGDGYVLFKPMPNRPDRMALVRVETAGGAGGKVRLSASTYTSKLKSGRTPKVRPAYNAFPDAGVQAFCTSQQLVRVNEGIEFLDVLLIMYEGARFRIQRTGRLEGASAWLDIRWTGEKLTLNREGLVRPEESRPRKDPYAGWRAPLAVAAAG